MKAKMKRVTSAMRRALQKARVFLRAAVGRWEAPPWVGWVGRKFANGFGWARAHRAVTAAVMVTTLMVAGGGFLGYRWWQNRPKPVTIDVAITAPGLTPIADRARPQPVVIDFDSSVAPLKAIGKPVTESITLEPGLAGRWLWSTDRQLTFTPQKDWPVGQHYEVELAKRLVADHINLSTYELEFSSAPFAVTLAEASFYQDPVDPSLKKVVATFRFSHPVDPATFEPRIHMHFEPGNKEERAFDVDVNVTYDKRKAEAYVHSMPFAIPSQDAKMQVRLDEGVRALRGGPAFDSPLSRPVDVPGLYNFFRVSDVRANIVDNARMEPERVLIARLSAGTTEKEISRVVSAWVLPVTNPDETDPKVAGNARVPYRYNAALISPAILKAGRKLALAQLPAEKEYADTQSFRFAAKAGRSIYVHVKKGAVAWGGYVLGEDFTKVLRVDAFPRQLKFLGSGSLLALGGERLLTLFARDVPGVRFEIARVLPDQLHHLVSVSSGTFSQPSFPYNFGPQNLADFKVETRAISSMPGKPVYETLDLSPYMAEGRRGLFLVKAESWDPQSKNTLGNAVSRLVLVTDLGVLAKRWANGAQDVFVQNVRTGQPVAGARVDVVGKNGRAVLSQTTDAQGRAHFPTLESFRAENAPVLYRATLGRDLAFLPIGRRDRDLETSRFAVGGISEPSQAQSLSAYLFSDRGVYRPGDEIRVGIIAKAKDWSQAIEGLPLLASIVDARGLEVKRQKITLGAQGFEELRHITPEVAPTGTYTVTLHTVRDGRPDSLLGSMTVQVREFLPDRMAIKVNLSDERREGWAHPAGLSGSVKLTNLFGTPAQGRRVRASLTLTPGLPSFGKLRGYRFFDPLRARDPVQQSLPDSETDDSGNAELELGLDRYARATYRLTLVAEGFEAAGGRGVTSESSVVVSPLSYLVGYKSDGDLKYITRGGPRSIELVAVGPTGERQAIAGLKAVLVQRQYVSVLARQSDGTYKYQSVKKEVELKKTPLKISSSGSRWTVPTETPGDFLLSVRNKQNEEIQRVDFSVAGYGDISRAMEKNAELELSLKSADVEPGGTIEMQIRAPYTGAGLITIERDKVYAFKWFKTTTTAAVETINVPEGMEGGGYVSVTFVRDPSSDEVFASPLSYGVVPFSISHKKREVTLTVSTPDLAKPGDKLRLKVRANRSARAVIYAVDEGILRVAHYTTPDPLSFFFQKRLLSVTTSQILDLILPDHQGLLRALAPGGDDEEEALVGANLNPFKRRRDKPVVYWSGIVDVGPEEKVLTYDVPDYFNGTLRVMAVAVSPEAVGAFQRRTVVRGDFVLAPNVPTFVAPGDTFEVPVLVANNVTGSGKDAKVSVTLNVSPHLEIVGAATKTVSVSEMRETTAKFSLKATHRLGSAAVTFEAKLGDKHGKLSTDLSVRPSSAFLTTLNVGYVKKGTSKITLVRKLYSEHRELSAGVSAVPLGLAHGLASYLEAFPHGCTEQVVSQAVPAVVLGQHPDFGFTRAKVRGAVAKLIDILRTRQNDDGSFGLWAANPRVEPEVVVYAMHVLTDARERGYEVPGSLLRKGTGYLKGIAGQTPESLVTGRIRAHAIYVLTRNEMNTNTFIAAAEKNLQANYPKKWQQDIAGAYLAASKKLLKQNAQATSLMEKCKFGETVAPDSGYLDGLSRDGQLLYLISRHFPDRAKAVGKRDIDSLVEPIANGAYNTYSSAFAIMGLQAYAQRAASDAAGTFSLAEIVGGKQTPIALPAKLLPIVPFSAKASALVVGSEGEFGAYFMTMQQGFDRSPPKQAQSSGVEVFREYVGADGKPIKEVHLGDEVRVRLRLRALKGDVSNVAIVDLLPGGFEVVVQSPTREADEDEDEEDEDEYDEGEDEYNEDEYDEGPSAPTLALPISLPGTTFMAEYGDVREDRVVLYGRLGADAVVFEYAIKATNIGHYVVPSLQAQGMYDRSVQARSAADTISVTSP